MKTAKLFTTAFLLLSFAGFSFGQKLGSNQITFKKEVFDQSLNNAVKPNVVGYQYVLIKDGKLVVENAGGLARKAADNGGTELKMTTTTPTLLGSLTKFLSGTAMLNLMEKESDTMSSSFKNKSFESKLDTPIWGNFPSVWADVIPAPSVPGPQQRDITYRKLLQHRSGFDDDWNKGQVRPFLQYMQSGFTPAQYDVWEYANMNFLTVGYMLPLVNRHNTKDDLNQQTWNASTGKPTAGMSQNEADKLIRDRLGKDMDALMRERIWNKITPKITLSCDAENTMKNTAAYTYDKKSDATGTIKSTLESNGHCVGQGAYYTSSRDFANYMAHFSATDQIVSKKVRDEMFDTFNPNDRLVWSFTTGDTWMKTNFNMPVVAWSNGIESGARTVLVRLPNEYYLVLFANSADMSVNQLYKAGVDAFKEGMKHNF